MADMRKKLCYEGSERGRQKAEMLMVSPTCIVTFGHHYTLLLKGLLSELDGKLSNSRFSMYRMEKYMFRL